MAVKIEYDKIMNFQSIEDITFYYKDGFNIIIADNETGKSIDKKIDKIMCFPNMYGRGNRKALIRKGKEFGYREIKLLDYDEPIIFKLYRTYQIYEWGAEQWKQDIIPDKIAEALGWIYDKEFEFLLHIIDNDTPKFLTTAPARLTGTVLKKLFSNHELEEFMNILKERSEECILSRKELNDKYNAMLKLYNMLNYKPLDDLSFNIQVREEMVNFMEQYLNIHEEISKLPDKPKYIEKLPDYKNNVLDIYKVLSNLPHKPNVVERLPEYNNDICETYRLILLLKDKPVQVKKLPEYNNGLLKIYTTISKIKDKPKQIEKLPDYKNILLATYKIISKIESKPNIVKILPEYKNKYLVLHDTISMLPTKPTQINKLQSYNDKLFKVYKLIKELDEVDLKRRGICPTCGQVIKKEGILHEECVDNS